MNKILIATGGTGGHIYPALAFAEIVKTEYPNCEIVFFGSNSRMEATLIPSKGYRFIGLDMTGMNGNIKAKLASFSSLIKAEKECKKILAKEKPDLCVGFGNYISVPLIVAASRMKIPTMIHEQNSSAGKANRLLGHYADAIVTCYESSMAQFPKNRTRNLGNPQATLASLEAKDDNAFLQYGFDPKLPLVIFMMGSLGSSSVSKVIDQSIEMFDHNIQILVAVGQSNHYEFHSKDSDHVKIVPYVNGAQMLKNCTLAVCRAGATTMCELSALGCASILIPSPYVPNNHQVINAMELVNCDAAIMIEEKDLNKESLSKTVNELVRDEKRLNMIRANAKKLGNPKAAYDMLDWIKELV